MLARAVRLLRRPLLRLLDRTVRFDDPWDRIPCNVPLERFGVGACHDFPWYFEGPSQVEANTVDEVKRWLLDCTYVRDRQLFRQADFWQHPCTFEQIRRGDCEDFALWTWRRLVEMGYPAQLIAGHWTGTDDSTAHAWVVFRDGDISMLFDPVIRKRSRMVRPLDAARDRYCPEVAVDHAFQRYAYAGYYLRRCRSTRPSGMETPAHGSPVAA